MANGGVSGLAGGVVGVERVHALHGRAAAAQVDFESKV